MSTDPEFITADGERIAVRRREGAAPGAVWLGGFRSDMLGTKAEALDGWAAANGRPFLRLEVTQDVIGDAVRELVAMGAVREKPTEGGNDRIDRLTAQCRLAVDQNDTSSQLGRLQGSRHAGDTGAHDTDIGLEMSRSTRLATTHDARLGTR